MKNRLIPLLLPLAFSALPAAASPAPPAAPPSFKKVLVVVLENTDYADAVRQPELARLAAQGALLTNFHAEAHPSQPNYLALVSGSTQGVTGDDTATTNARNIVDLLEKRDRSWKTYLEDYPGGCFTGESAGHYVRKHNPLISFQNVRGSPGRCARLVPASQLAADVRADRLPDFSLYIPDLKNDGHDTNVSFAGRWLATRFLPSLGRELPKDLLVVITFDETSSSTGDNHVYTALLGAGVRSGMRADARYDHFSLLRTIESRLDLGSLGPRDGNAPEIAGIWR